MRVVAASKLVICRVGRVSILHGAVLPSTDSPDADEEHGMSKAAIIGGPAGELERLIADLPG